MPKLSSLQTPPILLNFRSRACFGRNGRNSVRWGLVFEIFQELEGTWVATSGRVLDIGKPPGFVLFGARSQVDHFAEDKLRIGVPAGRTRHKSLPSKDHLTVVHIPPSKESFIFDSHFFCFIGLEHV